MSFLHPKMGYFTTHIRVDYDLLLFYFCSIMKHVSILIPKGQVITDTIIGSHGLFELANSYHKKLTGNQEGLLEIELVGEETSPIQFNRFMSLTPTKSIHQAHKTDFIVVPGLVGNMQKQIDLNRSLIEWMKNQRIQHNAEIASLCRGAFLLAETGLMHGKSCATHWLTHDTFKEMYPNVKLMPEKIISDDNGIYSSGGAYSFLSLILYIIEKYFGRETAIWCAKVSEIEFDRLDQNQFVIFNGQKGHSDEEIKEVQEHIEKHFNEKLSVESLAEKVATSSRNFVRRFKKATHNTPIEYIQRVRIEAAKKNLESTTMSIMQVMISSGYNDDKTFRTLFKRYAGLTPYEYRNKYNREAAYV